MPKSRRTQYLDQALIYLFSYDVEVEMNRENLGFVPGGVRVNIAAKPNRSRVYHVLRDGTIGGLGFDAISGKLSWGGDRVFWRDDDIEFSSVNMTIHTEDGAEIDVEYENITPLGPGGFRRLVSGKDPFGSESRPVTWPIVTSPRFDTTSLKYLWLRDYQGMGFGRVQIIKSEPRRISYDVYVLT